MENNTIYYGSAMEARAAGELDMFRASAEKLRQARANIDRIISDHFDGWRLDKETVPEIILTAGPEAAAVILAATVTDRDHDGRISASARAWANAVRLPACEPWTIAARTHSTILDGVIRRFIAETEGRKEK